jgi:hypothetical protein
MDLLSILLNACHRAMLNISSQWVVNDTGLTCASGKCATPCHVQRDRAPLQTIFLSQVSTFLIALVSLCALEQAVCRSTGINERDSEDSFTLTFRSHLGRLAAPARRQP